MDFERLENLSNECGSVVLENLSRADLASELHVITEIESDTAGSNETLDYLSAGRGQLCMRSKSINCDSASRLQIEVKVEYRLNSGQNGHFLRVAVPRLGAVYKPTAAAVVQRFQEAFGDQFRSVW